MTDFETLDRFVNNKSIGIDESSFYTWAVEYSIDPGYALSIWIIETGWGKSSLWVDCNNPAGIKASETEYASYSSKEEGMRAMFKLLRYYCDSGRCTVDGIRTVWSESDDTEEIVSVWKQIILGK